MPAQGPLLLLRGVLLLVFCRKQPLFGKFSCEAPLSYLQVMPGLLLGGVLPFVFCGFTMLAVGKAASAVIQEVRHGTN